MTESEWLSCTDPQVMLRSLECEWEKGGTYSRVSDRKLQLWLEAVSSRAGRPIDDPDAGTQQSLRLPERWATAKHACITFGEKADILRDIVGNPFRSLPVWVNQGKPGMGPIDAPHINWITPTVLAIAQAAYEERPGRKCEQCNGKGQVAEKNYHGCWEDYGCTTCHGIGRIEDGHLDPVTLGILADALEDAGCILPREPKRIIVYRSHGGHAFEVVARPAPANEDEVIHTAARLKDAVRWAEVNCGISGGWHRLAPSNIDIYPRQMFASLVGEGYLPAQSHPIVAHLRSPGPHVRGMWSLDLILGKE